MIFSHDGELGRHVYRAPGRAALRLPLEQSSRSFLLLVLWHLQGVTTMESEHAEKDSSDYCQKLQEV